MAKPAYTGTMEPGYLLNRTVFDPAIDDMRRAAYKFPVVWHARDLNHNWHPIQRRVDRIIAKYVSRDLDAENGSNWASLKHPWRRRIREFL
jgi:hypothetical protein